MRFKHLFLAGATLVFASHLISRSANEEFVPCSAISVPGDMACIPGGPFIRGSNRLTIDEDSRRKSYDESPQSTVTLSTFLMDKYEVTYSQYEECVKAGGCKNARTNYGGGYRLPQRPKMGLNWYHAFDYCKWRGKRLPSEAEWEKAARGEKGELFPWGNDPATCKNSIILEKGKRGCGTGITWNVGSKPSFRYGLYDIAGNSWEWVHDWYSPSYKACGADCQGKDPKGPCQGALNCPGHVKKVVRGGSWWWPGSYALGHNRRPHFALNKPYHHFGFRCAQSVTSP